jgi:DNA anti-recombination protein RmuC
MSTGQASAKKMDESGEEKKRRGPPMQTLQRTNKVPFSWVATYEFDDAHPSLKEINAQRLAQRKTERQKARQQRRKRKEEKLRERQIERERRRDAAKNLLGLVRWKWVNPVNIGPT